MFNQAADSTVLNITWSVELETVNGFGMFVLLISQDEEPSARSELAVIQPIFFIY